MPSGSSSALPPDAFVALAAVAWADGKLDAHEADAIVRAAAEQGVSLEGIALVEQRTKAYGARARDVKDRPDLTFLDRSTMTKHDRVFLYAVACWIAQIDRIVTADESDTLKLLGERLGVPDRLRARAEEVALEIAALPDGDRPDRYDLIGLRGKIGDRLALGQGTSRSG